MAHADDARLRRSNNDPAEDQPGRAPHAEARPDTLTAQEQSSPDSSATPTSEETHEEPPVSAEPSPHDPVPEAEVVASAVPVPEAEAEAEAEGVAEAEDEAEAVVVVVSVRGFASCSSTGERAIADVHAAARCDGAASDRRPRVSDS